MTTAIKTKSKISQNKLTSNTAVKTAEDIFAKIKTKTGISNDKIDKWQKNWFKMPETRKKYAHLQDVPQVIGEELFAMTNDIIDFIQGQDSKQSHVLKNLKENTEELLHNPTDFIKSEYQKGKKIAEKGIIKAKKTIEQGKKLSAKHTSNLGKSKLVGGFLARAKTGIANVTAQAEKAKNIAMQIKEKTTEVKKIANKAKSVTKKKKK